MSKKKLISLSLVVIMIAILSFSTLAWFSDNDEVTNQFYVASSDDDTADEIFSVDVWENTPDGDKDQDGYAYKDILPGDVLKKEVYVENTGYYDQYIRVTVTVSDAAAWQAALNTTKIPDLGDIVNGYDRNANVWVGVSSEIVDDAIVYTLYYNGILDGSDDTAPEGTSKVTVFTEVNIPERMTVEQAAAFKNSFEITVKAEAVQTENLGVDKSNNEIDAVEAFAVVDDN